MGKNCSVTKRITFDAAHYLHNPHWDKDDNVEIFHACSKFKDDGKEEPHGHTYHLEITIGGEIDELTGFVMDFKILKKILKEQLLLTLDHRLLNNISYFKDRVCTVENLLYYIWEVLDKAFEQYQNPEDPGGFLEKLELWETPDSYGTLTRADVEQRCN